MPLISTNELIGFCQRVGMSLKSGVDIRRVFEQESKSGSARYRQAMASILDGIKQGQLLSAAMRQTEYFPAVPLAMVEIGENTGRIDEVLSRLASHYSHQRSLQWQFAFGILWPTLQLTAAVFIIGLLIYVFGAIADYHPGTEPVDVTGLGLSGTRGVLIYFLAVGVVVSGLAAFIITVAKGWLGPRAVELAMRIPVLGACLRHMAMSRLTWSLGMALDAGIEAKRSVELSLVATQNPYYLSRRDAVVASIAKNREFYESFRDAEGFPGDFLVEMETAEIAGTLSESLVRMSHHYDDKARTSLQILTWIATIGIWLVVAAILVMLIFRLFFFYLGTINQALEWTEPGKF